MQSNFSKKVLYDDSYEKYCYNKKLDIFVYDKYTQAYCGNRTIFKKDHYFISDLNLSFSEYTSATFHNVVKSASIRSIMSIILTSIQFSKKKMIFYDFPDLNDIISFEHYLPTTGFEFWVINYDDNIFDYENQSINTKWRKVNIGLFNNSRYQIEYFHYTSHSETDLEVINLSYEASLAIIIVLIIVSVGILVSLGIITYFRFRNSSKVSNEPSSMERTVP